MFSSSRGTHSITEGWYSFMFFTIYFNPSQYAILAPLYIGNKNPNVEFNMAEAPENPKYDARIEASVPLNDLKLPEGFYCMSNGISNKYSSSEQPVIIEVGTLAKKEELMST